MRRQSVFKTLGVTEQEFTDLFLQNVKGMSALEFASAFKHYTANDLQILCKQLGIPFYPNEVRVSLLAKLHAFIKDNRQDSQEKKIRH